MSCRFYGKNGMFGTLIDQGGNECALVVDSYSPCRVEMAGGTPDDQTCELALQLGPAKDRECSGRTLSARNYPD